MLKPICNEGRGPISAIGHICIMQGAAGVQYMSVVYGPVHIEYAHAENPHWLIYSTVYGPQGFPTASCLINYHLRQA